MKRLGFKGATAAAALLAFTGVASAQLAAMATTNLNIRSGPGTDFPVVGVIGTNQEAVIHGCLEDRSWCSVTHAGVEGWAYAGYLITGFDGDQITVSEAPPAAVPQIAPGTTAGIGAATGAITGAIIGGPAGAAVGGAAGAIAGGAVETIVPPPRVRTFVQENPVEPVYLEGRVAVGAGLPETVEIREIPDYEYRYVYVNERPVLVEPRSRRIVYVMGD